MTRLPFKSASQGKQGSLKIICDPSRENKNKTGLLSCVCMGILLCAECNVSVKCLALYKPASQSDLVLVAGFVSQRLHSRTWKLFLTMWLAKCGQVVWFDIGQAKGQWKWVILRWGVPVLVFKSREGKLVPKLLPFRERTSGLRSWDDKSQAKTIDIRSCYWL